MATLYITEYAGTAKIGGALSPVPSAYPLAEQTVAISGSSASSAAFGNNTHLILVESDSICSLAFGATPTAVATAHRMAANEARYYEAIPGTKIAVISNT